ncbi:MAG: hypothetical protein ACHQFW_11530, partial [Chitinophagales bacterium]
MRAFTKFFLLSLLTTTISIKSFAQGCAFSDDYSNAGLWTYFYYYYDVTGTCLSDEQHGSLTISGGALNYNNTNDANDTRFYRDLGFTLNEDFWTCAFEFTPESAGAAGRTGHTLFALSNGNGNPISDTYSICTFLNQDAIAVMWFAEYAVDPDSVGFEIWANDNGVVTFSDRIPVDYGSTYYMQLTRIDFIYMELDVFADPDHTDLIGTIPCFEIPSTINGLNTLQHGNFPGGS